MIFIISFFILLLSAVIIVRKAKQSDLGLLNSNFSSLQSKYLQVYYLATFADFLQGPYIYKLYSDYGFKDDDIAVLYIAGFVSSTVFGMIVGVIADSYGRKFLCASFGFFYSICCCTKLSPDFYILLFGRICGGIATSILFTTFEAWYINEHINHYNLPVEWLNITFGKTSFYTGLLAIFAGVVSQFFAEFVNLGPTAPFLIAIPFLLLSSYIIMTNWNEHLYQPTSSKLNLLSPLKLIILKDHTLLLLGLVQCSFEATMYSFIFSWTPIIRSLNPPLGLVFSSFMLAFIIGSKLYGLMISKHKKSENILTFVSIISFIALSIVFCLISFMVMSDSGRPHDLFLTKICFLCFIIYELCLGAYMPAIGYLKGRVVPEKYRTSVTNWFRVPTNIFTCVTLTLNNFNKKETEVISNTETFNKFTHVYLLCSIFLIVSSLASYYFGKKYSKRFSQSELFTDILNLTKDTGKDTLVI
uniref:Molybdate-anion transporter n=1 Tax=Clastoptera arizonana TaxID=38151 RepID=A0A1B6DB15_9HEMI